MSAATPGLLHGWTTRVFLLLCVAHGLTVLFSFDNSFLVTGAPLIAKALNISAAEWLANANLIATAAFLPLANGLSKVYGRRDPLLASTLIFMLGAIVSAVAKSESVMLLGRVIQGIGDAFLVTISTILVVDVLPLTSRGLGLGVVFAGWSIGYALGPLAAGALGEKHWPFDFYVQLPLAALMAILLTFAGRGLGRPKLNRREQLKRIDWLGNILAIGAITSIALGFSWSGSEYSWSSAAVWVPITSGTALIAGFIMYERRLEHPSLPFEVFAHGRTVCIGYFGCFIHLLIQQGAAYAVVIYLQTAKLQTSLTSALGALTFLASGMFFGLVTGFWVNWRKTWRVENVIAYLCLTLGCVFLAHLNVNTPTIGWVGAFLLAGFGSGALYSLEDYPTLAPLPRRLQADGTAFILVCNIAGQILGVSLTTTILQSRLLQTLPSSFINSMSDTKQLLYVSIDQVRTLSEPELSQVQHAFVGALQILFFFFAGLSGVQTVLCLFFEHTTLHEEVDATWDFQREERTSMTGTDGQSEAIEL